jgi:uncharacterized membrane protein (UPF0127 family)
MVETRSMRSALLAFSLAVATCQRVDEPVPGSAEPPPAKAAAQTPAPVATPTGTPAPNVERAPEPVRLASPSDAAVPTTAPDAGRCIQPLLEPPPPVARPATSCPPDNLSSPPVLRRGKVSVPELKGVPVLDVEIADTPATEQRGLMFRTELGKNQGMIFVFKRESIRTFWMRNTCIPLDMLFLAADGTIVGLLEQVPTLNEQQRRVRCPAAYVLEVNAGWTRRHGVKPGMKLELSL